MTFLANMISKQKCSGSGSAELTLRAFKVAIQTGDLSELPRDLKDLVLRVTQADAKISSGALIARTSELMTLAQFGAGSIGAAIALAFTDPTAKSPLENLMTAGFLLETILSAKLQTSLIPEDLLKKEKLRRDTFSWPSAEPVYKNLSERAVQALCQASLQRNAISTKPARKFFDHEYAKNVYQVRKLTGKDPNLPTMRLNTLDHFIISLIVLLHIPRRP
jgi:hypothetical protein